MDGRGSRGPAYNHVCWWYPTETDGARTTRYRLTWRWSLTALRLLPSEYEIVVLQIVVLQASPNGTRPSPLAPMVTGEESDTLGDTYAQLSPASPVAKRHGCQEKWQTKRKRPSEF